LLLRGDETGSRSRRQHGAEESCVDVLTDTRGTSIRLAAELAC
jgi:hypothetical protein